MALTLHGIKPRFQALLRPLAGRFAAAGITADQMTLAATVAGLWAGLVPALPEAASWIAPVTSTAIAVNVVNRVRAGVARAGTGRH
jgi:CDP-diacylglycerol--glycerol-3-phosphate 3-phosphatidyltransferase